MKKYLEEIIKPSGLSISPEAVDCIKNATTIYAQEFMTIAKEIDGESPYHQKYDIGIELALNTVEQPIIVANTKEKYFQKKEVHKE